MKREFLNQAVDYEQIVNDNTGIAERYVLKNNKASIKKIHGFLSSDKSILLINGFCGTGKKQITEVFLSNLTSDTTVCKFVCTQSTTINDLYLFLSTSLKSKIKDDLEKDFNILTNYSPLGYF